MAGECRTKKRGAALTAIRIRHGGGKRRLAARRRREGGKKAARRRQGFDMHIEFCGAAVTGARPGRMIERGDRR